MLRSVISSNRTTSFPEWIREPATVSDPALGEEGLAAREPALRLVGQRLHEELTAQPEGAPDPPDDDGLLHHTLLAHGGADTTGCPILHAEKVPLLNLVPDQV